MKTEKGLDESNEKTDKWKKEPEWWIRIVAASNTVRIGGIAWERKWITIEERELRANESEEGSLPWGGWWRKFLQGFDETIFKSFTSHLGFFHSSSQCRFTHSYIFFLLFFFGFGFLIRLLMTLPVLFSWKTSLNFILISSTLLCNSLKRSCGSNQNAFSTNVRLNCGPQIAWTHQCTFFFCTLMTLQRKKSLISSPLISSFQVTHTTPTNTPHNPSPSHSRQLISPASLPPTLHTLIALEQLTLPSPTGTKPHLRRRRQNVTAHGSTAHPQSLPVLLFS